MTKKQAQQIGRAAYKAGLTFTQARDVAKAMAKEDGYKPTASLPETEAGVAYQQAEARGMI